MTNYGILIEALTKRTGHSHCTIESIIENLEALGYQITRRRTHADVHLPNVSGRSTVHPEVSSFTVLEGDR